MKKTLWLLPLLLAIPLLAVTPQFWEVRTYDEFRRGKLIDVSLTSDNELVLAPRFDSVFNTEQTLIWSAITDSKGNVFVGTGHDGKIFKIDSAGKGTMIADLAELDVTALAIDSKDVLYAATSPDGKVYRIDGAAPKDFYDPDAKYIWAMTFDRQGRLLVATGDKGVIYRVTPDGKGESFYDTDETHIISMTLDKDGNVIAGGDPKGYIYRIAPDGKAFVLYDSGMREVHAVAVGANGNIYAAVLSGKSSLSPAAAVVGPVSSSSGNVEASISVTVGSAEKTAVSQGAEVVITSTDSPDVSSPRTAGRRGAGDANSQSVILEILPDGTVNTLWRSRDEMVFSILPQRDRLLFSTGTKGRIYSFSSPRDTTLLVEGSEEQTTRLLSVGNRIYAATANIGKLFSMSDALATSGTYESIVRDTDAISTWGKLSWKAQNLELMQVFTRSGNTSSPDKTWSEWATVDTIGTPSSPRARFIQWKAVLRSDRTKSPRLTSMTVPYLQQNFRPDVAAIDVLPSGVALARTQTFGPNGAPTAGNDAAAARAALRAGQPAPPKIPPRRINQRGAQSFQWTAADKNDDFLTYDVYYRGDGERNWRLLKKDLDDSFYTINSDTLPDGIYQVRVVAIDQPSNPGDLALTGEAESRTFSIDNTPPTVTMKLDSVDKDRARIAIDAVDSTSTLNQAEVSVDTGDWRPIFSKDGIIDSKSEAFSYLSGPLSAGEHVVAFRVYDQNDNVGMQKLIVRIP